jgi:hypothetical protein
MDMSIPRWVCLLALTCALNAEPVTRGKPVSLGAVGAGEGPAWSPKGGLYFSGGNRITRRDIDGKTCASRKGAALRGRNAMAASR